MEKHDKFNIPCHGCKYQDEYCSINFAISWGNYDGDYLFEPSDCKSYCLIDAGISKSEALGMKLWEE